MLSRIIKAPGGRKTRGQTLVEVTLIIPLLLLLVGASLDWGLAFFVSHVVQNAVRSAARLAVTINTPVSGTTVRDEVRRVIPDTPLFAAFRNNANITVECIPPTASAPPFMRVRTFGTFSFYFMHFIGLSTTTIDREVIMKYERAPTCPTIS